MFENLHALRDKCAPLRKRLLKSFLIDINDLANLPARHPIFSRNSVSELVIVCEMLSISETMFLLSFKERELDKD